MNSEQLLSQLQNTISNLVETTKEITHRINTDIKDLYDKVNGLREDVVRIQTLDVLDKDSSRRLEASLEAIKKVVDDLNSYMATEKGRQTEEEANEKKTFRNNILKAIGVLIAGGGAGAGIVEVLRMVNGAA